METKSIFIEVEHPPSVNHTYVPGGKGKMYMKGNVKRFKSQTAWIAQAACKKQGWECTDVPVAMTIWWTPKDHRRRDVSNIVKALEDALGGIVYKDDQQVEQLLLIKLKPDSPGKALVKVEILVNEPTAA